MDAFELNKIAGAFLFTCLVVLGLQSLAGIVYHPAKPEKPGFAMEIEEASDGTAEAGTKADKVPLGQLLASADAEKGQKVAKKCAACHTFNEGGKVTTGPNLYNIVGRTMASTDGFKYSDAMIASGKPWTYEELDGFLAAPKKWLPGTKMGYKGISKPNQRADLLAYLRTLSASPVDFPVAEKAAEAASESAAEDAMDAVKDTVEGATEAVKDAAEGATEAVKDAAEGATEAVKDAAEGATEAVKDAAEGATEAVKDAAEGAMDSAVEKAPEAAAE